MRLIDADELKRAIEDRIDYVPSNDYDEGWNSAINTAIDEINNAPTVSDRYDEGYVDGLKEGLKDEPIGKWIDHSEDYGYVECPKCEHLTNCEGNVDELHYCWNCGAKLGKGGAE